MKKSYAFLISLLLLLSACTTEGMTLDKASIGVIYTDSLKEDSEFVLLNQDGQIVDQRGIKEKGIFQIAKKKDGSLLLPVQFGDKMVQISSGGIISKEDTPAFPLYVRTDDSIRVTTYNTHMDYGTLEIKEGDQVHTVKLDGYLSVVQFDAKYVYVSATIIQAKRPVFYVLDRETGKLVKEISIKVDLTDDLLLTEEHILVSSTDDQHKIAVINKKDWTVQYRDLSYAQPQFFYPNKDKIIVTHKVDGRITVLDRKTFQVVETAQLPQRIYKARLSSDQLYVLSPLNYDPKNAGLISVYDTKTWKQIKQFRIPNIRETLVQDFTIIQ
ncbi:YncE family protein [Thermoactinomyces sp. DSM 45892]|uniref:YncE family protein n=1 Tax=Thermoactinomyces sp. DSM 45892 TaxID=1882753 RepID=UPI00089C56CC|nr:PQQ-binding-like beta-propeller repeat protein [Thermoactinomyces sp. DSM 45892]SDY86738.1 PQQ-like domain-containing protein [Thermoactinomyces sp. DSM 45892]